MQTQIFVHTKFHKNRHCLHCKNCRFPYLCLFVRVRNKTERIRFLNEKAGLEKCTTYIEWNVLKILYENSETGKNNEYKFFSVGKSKQKISKTKRKSEQIEKRNVCQPWRIEERN